MDGSLKKLLRLIDADHPAEVRRAALIVLGELGGKDKEAAEVVWASLTDEAPEVRIEAIRTAGKLKVEQAMSPLLERIKEGGAEGEAAAEAVAHMGAKGTKALQDLMPRVAPGLRRYIASALGSGGTASAETAAVAVLLDSDPGVVEAAVKSLAAQVPTLSAAHRKDMVEHLLGMLAGKKKPAPVSERAIVRLLAVIDDPRVEKVLWQRVLPPNPPDLRAAALSALGRWAKSPGKEQLKMLFRCATDRNFAVAAPALALLQHIKVDSRNIEEWLTLVRAPDVAVKRFGMDRVGEIDKSEVAAALVEQLDHPDRKLREEAVQRMAKLKTGRAAMLEALLEAPNPDRAWFLARAQAAFLNDRTDWRDDVFNKASAYLEEHDRRADALWFLLRETDPADLSDRLEKKAIALRKKKDYQTALLYLKLMAGDPACGFPIRVELACCGLKTSTHDLSPDHRANDPSLQQLARLCQGYQDELLDYLNKAKWLDPEDLYYAGFHLAEQTNPLKQCGGRILEMVAKRSPRSKIGQAAKQKLRSEGLA